MTAWRNNSLFVRASQYFRKHAGLVVFLGMVALVCAILSLNYIILLQEPDTARGTFGDMFGFSNALFSGLAFAGIFYAFWLQRSEIKIAKEELEGTKVLIEKQQEQINIQIRDGEILSFEQSFFKQIDLLNIIISGIDLLAYSSATGPGRRTVGRDVISVLVRRLTESQTPDYEHFYESNGNEIGHYYRLLYNILAFIDRSCPTDRLFYTRIVRAQLSNAEVQLLYHNCLSQYGQKLKPLVEKYSMLKHFSPTASATWEILNYSKYDPRAFDADGFQPRWMPSPSGEIY